MLQELLAVKVRYEKNIKWVEKWYPFDDAREDAFKLYVRSLKEVLEKACEPLDCREVEWLKEELGEDLSSQLTEGGATA